MSVKRVLRSIILSDPQVSEIVGEKVFVSTVAQSAPRPWATIMLASSERGERGSAPPTDGNFGKRAYLIDIASDDPYEAETIGLRISNLLEGWRGSGETYDFSSVWVDNETEYDEESGSGGEDVVHHYQLDITVNVKGK